MVRVWSHLAGWSARPAPGARGRRRRAARALSELLQPKKVILHAGFLVRLYKRITPHRPTEADFRSTVPFSRSGMRLFNGLGCSVSCSTQATSSEKRRRAHRVWDCVPPLVVSWSTFSRSAHLESPPGDASPRAMARAGLTAPCASTACLEAINSTIPNHLFSLTSIGSGARWLLQDNLPDLRACVPSQRDRGE